MLEKTATVKRLFIFLVLGYIFWLIPAPDGLVDKQWHLLVIFIFTVIALISNFLPMGVIMLISIIITVLTGITTMDQSLSGFSSHVVWLVVMAFFIARAIIKSNLAKRVAYHIIQKMGRSILGLSYSLIFTEFLLSPAIPSATARGGGIIFPIAKSMSDQFSEQNNVRIQRIREFIMQSCFQANVICSAMFLTAMAGNPLILQLAAKLNVEITWKLWALGGILPGLVNLLIMPLFLYQVIKPDITDSKNITVLAKKGLADLGKMTQHEHWVLRVFILLILMWIFGDYFAISATTTAIIGFLILVLTKVITWEDAIDENNAWNTFIWFALFITLSNFLSDYNVTEWIARNVQKIFAPMDIYIALPSCLIIFFYLHYFFASITVYATVMYSVFFYILVCLNVNNFLAAMILAYFSNISGGLAHYTISSAPIFYAGSKLSTRRWWYICLITSFMNLFIWSVVGFAWWKILGWW